MPKYKNKGGQPREKCMIAAYALTQNYGATQETVAAVLGCSQGTIANWVKEISYKNEISGLKKELESANNYIEHLADELNLIEYNPGEDDEGE
jgi:transcription initiation factor TFIIIB Brf1 subunit/transcription initiation factor TFIIB